MSVSCRIWRRRGGGGLGGGPAGGNRRRSRRSKTLLTKKASPRSTRNPPTPRPTLPSAQHTEHQHESKADPDQRHAGAPVTFRGAGRPALVAVVKPVATFHEVGRAHRPIEASRVGFRGRDEALFDHGDAFANLEFANPRPRDGLHDRKRDPADNGDDRNPQRRNPHKILHVALQEPLPELIRLDGRRRCFTGVA